MKNLCAQIGASLLLVATAFGAFAQSPAGRPIPHLERRTAKSVCSNRRPNDRKRIGRRLNLPANIRMRRVRVWGERGGRGANFESAGVLAEWNPLGSRADSVSDLDGYRIEAIDIIMALGVFRSFVAPEETVCNILNQAFDLSLKPIDCVVPARKIQLIIGTG